MIDQALVGLKYVANIFLFVFSQKNGVPNEVKDLKAWFKEKQFLFSALVQGGEMLVRYGWILDTLIML